MAVRQFARKARKVRRARSAEATASAAKAHVFAPANVKKIRMEEVDPDREVRYRMPARRVKVGRRAGVDLGAMGLAIWNALKDNVSGYILHIRQNGTLVHVGVWNWAQTPADAAKGWTEDTRMHLASVSKFLTAAGTVHLLDTKGLSYDTPIVNYLPTHWTKGANINKITFRHLMTHTSGFSTGGSATDYATMKARVAAGVPGVGSYDYENMNFGLCRLLIPIVSGAIAKNTTYTPSYLNDAFWDLNTINAYQAYMQAKVFTPSGVANADFEPLATTPNALAYPFPFGITKGWNSGDLKTVAGGAGWRLSLKELLNVMNHVRRKGTIVTAAKAQYMLDNYFGIDQIINSAAGKLYNKNGSWGTGDGKTEQCVAYFLPQGMELAILVNSKIGTTGFSLRTIVKDAYVNSLT
jgi:CubicO group peptidase (beta-lactamase class C family)